MNKETLAKLWETDPGTVNTIQEQTKKIHKLTRTMMKKKTVDLDKYDEIHIECLNLCLLWRDLHWVDLEDNPLGKSEPENSEDELNFVIRKIYDLIFHDPSPQISEIFILSKLQNYTENLLKEISIVKKLEE